MKKSVWEKSTNLPHFESLKGSHKTDVLIIGGGLFGILCAYMLDKSGVDYILLEGNKVCSGTTKNTTGKITSQHSLIYSKLIKELGREKAKMYLQANEDALLNYEKICSKLSCDFEIKNAYTYSLSDRKVIEDEVKAAQSLDMKAVFKEELNLPFKTKGAVMFPHQAQFNPLRFVSEISRGLNIYENSFVKCIANKTAIGDGFSVKADKIITATHFPFINKHGLYFLKLYQHRSYVSAFENAQDVDGMYVDESKTGLSFRNYNGLLLIGGGSHRTGKKGGGWKEINDFAKKAYPRAEIKYSWAAQDCMSLDSIPYIGRYSKNTTDLYVASGFNKWGMTSSMTAAMILCDLVCDNPNEYAPVFSPQRSILKPQLLVNTAETTLNLLTPVPRRCSHLGCALKWNKQEHTWDCPCHGSRFDENGKVLENPATKNLNI